MTLQYLMDENGIIFPNQWTAPGDATELAAGQTLLLPDPSRDNFTLQTQEPKGITEVLIIASVTPLEKALAVLQTIATSRNQQQGPVALTTPLEAIEDLLSDLGQSQYRSRNTSIPVKEGVHLIDTTQVAAMSMTFEVI